MMFKEVSYSFLSILIIIGYFIPFVYVKVVKRVFEPLLNMIIFGLFDVRG